MSPGTPWETPVQEVAAELPLDSAAEIVDHAAGDDTALESMSDSPAEPPSIEPEPSVAEESQPEAPPEARAEDAAKAVAPVRLEPVPEPVVPAPATPESKNGAAAIPGMAGLDLTPADLARSLVALGGVVDRAAMASYERMAGKVLAKTWNRTSLFFTSAQAGEGSSEAAVNLATTLSRTAESVLLVDLHMTDPAVWPLLGRPAIKRGFEEALRGHTSFEECLQEIAGERLEVLLLKQPMTAEEAAHCSGVLNDFLEWAEERFAWIVVVCPPVLATTWTRWFALNADPVVLVARSEHTRRRELRMAARRLGDRLAGAILSGIKPSIMPSLPSLPHRRRAPVFPPIT